MYQAIEAISKGGVILPLEPVQFDENEHLVILRLPKNLSSNSLQRARGAMKGQLSSVNEFIAAKSQELALEER
ncbi:MAG: antitoxin family protein [Methylomonas sp.]|jgi:predicted DNA-binding antitoxin AbrB/MazE fold protein